MGSLPPPPPPKPPPNSFSTLSSSLLICLLLAYRVWVSETRRAAEACSLSIGGGARCVVPGRASVMWPLSRARPLQRGVRRQEGAVSGGESEPVFQRLGLVPPLRPTPLRRRPPPLLISGPRRGSQPGPRPETPEGLAPLHRPFCFFWPERTPPPPSPRPSETRPRVKWSNYGPERVLEKHPRTRLRSGKEQQQNMSGTGAEPERSCTRAGLRRSRTWLE